MAAATYPRRLAHDAFSSTLAQAVGVPMVPVSFLVMAGSLGAVSATGVTTPAPREDNESEKRAWRNSCFTVGALLICLRLVIVSYSLFILFIIVVFYPLLSRQRVRGLGLGFSHGD